jgi:hypothetical protein
VFQSKCFIYLYFFGLSERCPNVFAVNKENPSDRINEHHPVTIRTTMAGISGKGGVRGTSGPPDNMNAFKHGLASIQKRREEGIATQHEENVRQQTLEGLIADKSGDEQVSTATRILAEVIASDASWLMAFNSAIDHIIRSQKFGQGILEGGKGSESCPTP